MNSWPCILFCRRQRSGGGCASPSRAAHESVWYDLRGTEEADPHAKILSDHDQKMTSRLFAFGWLLLIGEVASVSSTDPSPSRTVCLSAATRHSGTPPHIPGSFAARRRSAKSLAVLIVCRQLPSVFVCLVDALHDCTGYGGQFGTLVMTARQEQTILPRLARPDAQGRARLGATDCGGPGKACSHRQTTIVAISGRKWFRRKRGGLFHLHVRASRLNDFSTQLFATATSLSICTPLFSRSPSMLQVVITGDVDL